MVTSDTERQPRRNNHHANATVSLTRTTMVVDMKKPDIETIRSRVQITLDELINEQLIPFKLTAYAISTDGPGRYVVPFYDSRIHSFAFSWTDESSSFKEAVRTAILDRVRAMSGPLRGWGSLSGSK